ncbi:hypothetical protein TNCV_5048321 [Trichonephila clavipes]|nr:hypothetical protein TNCV_5048321 [Trichonephila clavipes]
MRPQKTRLVEQVYRLPPRLGLFYSCGGSGRRWNTNPCDDRTFRCVVTSSPIKSLESIRRHLPPSKHHLVSRETADDWPTKEKETPYLSKRIDQERISTLSKKIAQGNLTASCKRLISWFLLFKRDRTGS